MKRAYYIFLMIILFIMIGELLYLSSLTLLVRYEIIPLLSIVAVTDIAMSSLVYTLVGAISGLLGYFFGQKCWKIIYIDKVYYFDKKISPRKRRVRKD